MGTCFSKKNVASSVNNTAHSSSSTSDPAAEQNKSIPKVRKETASAAAPVRKEVFVIRHSRTNSRDGGKQQPPSFQESDDGVSIGKVKVDVVSRTGSRVVRSSSCTKEEVDAILIQCGRLSRSSSFGTPGKKSAARRKSGSKRSYDFDEEKNGRERYQEEEVEDGELAADEASPTRDRRRLNRRRESSRNSSPASSQGRRRTPSRERDERAGSRERVSVSGSGRRVSRSPGKRLENATAAMETNVNANRPPGKMVSVPATVSSHKASCNNYNAVEAPHSLNGSGIKRISVMRNVGMASPRSQSPSRANNEGNQQQQPSPRRNSSRKAEHSPYRRNPLAEIDPNLLSYPPLNAKNDVKITGMESFQKPNSSQQTTSMAAIEEIAIPPQQLSLRRSRSGRRSRDLDINPEALLNPQPTTYTSLLLQDINNFHHKNGTTTTITNNNNSNSNGNIPSSFELPACLKKACSILEAVADLNSTPTSNLSSSSTLSSEEHHPQRASTSKQRNLSEAMKDPSFAAESVAVLMDDDLMEPSFHTYVTVRRGSGGEDFDWPDQESSGSNSVVTGGNQQQQQPPSSLNSGDSTKRKEKSSSSAEVPLGLGIGQRVHGLSGRIGGEEIEVMMEEEEGGRKGFSSGQRNGIGRGRVGGGGNRSRQSSITATSVAAAASSTHNS